MSSYGHYGPLDCQGNDQTRRNDHDASNSTKTCSNGEHGQLRLSPHTAVLVFDLTDEDGKNNHRLAVMAEDMHLVLWHLDNDMRADVKYMDGEKTSWHWRDRLHELLYEYGVTLDL